MSNSKIIIEKKSVNQVLRCVDEGKFAIPKLQREFVWDGPKAAKLLDSMLSGLPIGVLMIWETPKSQRLYLRQRYHVLPPFKDQNSNVWFLIDGQQRVSVLHHIREGSKLDNARGTNIDFRRVVISLEHETNQQQIRYRRPVQGKYVSLSDILHFQWQSRLGYLTKRYRTKVRRYRRQILKYPLYLMFIKTKLKEVKECFLRINTQGMKITTADAIFVNAEDLDLRDVKHEVRQNLDDSFVNIPEMPILFAMAAIRGGKEARGQALQQFINRLEKQAKGETSLRKLLAKDWTRLSRCFGKAVDYLRQNFAVLNRDFLYSDYIISIMALFYYWNGVGPNNRQKERINKWFWATSVGSRYSGKNFLKCLPDDIEFFKKLAEDGNVKFHYVPQIDKADVRKTQFSADSGIASAFYCMMLRRHPVSIMDDSLNEIPVERYSTRANRKDRHHIFPRAVLSAAELPSNLFNSICNICLLTAEENQIIGAKRPSSYLGEVAETGHYFRKKMARHLIPVHEDSGIWLPDIKRGFIRFMKERNDVICNALEKEAGLRLFRRDV